MKESSDIQDCLIIGGGAGGLTIASGLAQLGLKVILIEKNSQLGGDCLHYGCVPSKTFIHSAKVARQIQRAGEYGLSASMEPVDLGKVNEHVKAVIDTIQEHDDPERFRSYGANVIFGEATFKSKNTVKVNDQIIEFKKAVIATGSRPVVPPITGLQEAGYVTNETVFNLRMLPKRLAILGGGVIGLELAQAFQRLGSEVIVLEAMPGLLQANDQELANTLLAILKAEGVTFHSETKVTKVAKHEAHKQLHCEPANGEAFQLDVDEILVATGRAPNIELGLENAGIESTKFGLEVDSRMRTNQKHIFAVGDVLATRYKFTHMAENEAGAVIANIAFKVPKTVNFDCVPAVIYTDPEFAHIGLTQEQAEKKGIKFDVYTWKFANNDRALAEVESAGMVKCLVRKNKLIGASILGPHGGELIAELALAMQAGLSISKISQTIHAYPTLSQINRHTINQHFSKLLFTARTRKIVAFLQRIF